MIAALAVALGGAIGAVARYGSTVVAARVWGINFPYGTLAVNIIGGLFMGVLVSLFAMREPVDPALKLFLTTGILGGFTTFSAFSLEAILLYERKPLLGIGYVALNVLLSIGACALGLKLTRLFT